MAKRLRIPIVDNIIMTAIPDNIVLNREIVNQKTGKKELKQYAYFPTVTQALESVLDEKLAESTAQSIKGLVRQHTELVAYFHELLGSDLSLKVQKKGETK